MPDVQALTVFLWVASICLILLTLLGFAVGVAVLWAALEVRAVLRRAEEQLDWAIERRRRLEYGVRFAGKWLSIMSRRIMR